MRLASAEASLTEQAYEAIVEAICDGSLPANVRLVQEQLADRFGVSRQPIQQALLLLRSDGIVVDGGGRGLVVAPRCGDGAPSLPDPRRARRTGGPAGGRPRGRFARGRRQCRRRGGEIVAAGRAAIEAGSSVLREMIARDVANSTAFSTRYPAIRPWRKRRRCIGAPCRVMGEALRHSWRRRSGRSMPRSSRAVAAGEAETAARLAVDHVRSAAERLAGPCTVPAAPQS